MDPYTLGISSIVLKMYQWDAEMCCCLVLVTQRMQKKKNHFSKCNKRQSVKKFELYKEDLHTDFCCCFLHFKFKPPEVVEAIWKHGDIQRSACQALHSLLFHTTLLNEHWLLIDKMSEMPFLENSLRATVWAENEGEAHRKSEERWPKFAHSNNGWKRTCWRTSYNRNFLKRSRSLIPDSFGQSDKFT